MIQDMPAFGLFPKQKKPNQPEQTAENIQKTLPNQTDKTITPEAQTEKIPINPPDKQNITTMPNPSETTMLEQTEPKIPTQTVTCKTYLKAIPLRELSDLNDIKTEIQNGNILILRITPLASKSVESVKSAVNELYAFTESIGGDIARLGEERVVICPKNIKIWREKTPAKTELLPTTVA